MRGLSNMCINEHTFRWFCYIFGNERLVSWVYPWVFNTHAGVGMVQGIYPDTGMGVGVVKIRGYGCGFG